MIQVDDTKLVLTDTICNYLSCESVIESLASKFVTFSTSIRFFFFSFLDLKIIKYGTFEVKTLILDTSPRAT